MKENRGGGREREIENKREREGGGEGRYFVLI
jgi:hypothetical protein